MAPERAVAGEDDFVPTIYDDEAGFEEEENVPFSDEERSTKIEAPGKGKKRKRDTAQPKSSKRQKGESPEIDNEDEAKKQDGDMDPDFDFQLDDGMAQLEDFDGWTSARGKLEKMGRDIDEIVASRKQGKTPDNDKSTNELEAQDDEAFDEELEDEEILADDAFGMGATSDTDESDQDDMESDQSEAEAHTDQEDDENDFAAPKAHPDDVAEDQSSDEEETEDPLETERRNAFFAPESSIKGDKPISKEGQGSFMDMSLSRPIMKGLSTLGFSAPTPIQNKAIPVALLGKDIVGSAETGSGKTGAFIIPILERLFYRSREAPTTRVVILLPTRELALQCYNVATKLASFTDITFGQAIGGMNQREQEKALKLRPDIVIATPGRFIDFMRNSSALTMDTIEILVLDEADRMLEDGFADELNEILASLPKSRQTMLFSATMTNSIDNLIRVGLTRPVRLMVDSARQTVSGLTQEFVRLRPGREDHRLAYLLSLCTTTYRDRTIIFFRQKALAHRIRVLFALLSLSAAELHGSMSQEQRISAIEAFRSGKANYLLATDLASRGLDIKNVSAVINYEAPQSHEIYLHRVGRTARAGRTGRACTLAAEPDRKVVKQAVKAARAQGAIIKSRQIAPEEGEKWAKKVEDLQDDIEAVLREEKEEKALATTEMQMRKADNVMAHEKEILGRPKKTWFLSEKEKGAAKEKGRVVLNGPDDAGAEKKKRSGKITNKQRKKLVDRDERQEGRLWKKGKSERSVGTNKMGGDRLMQGKKGKDKGKAKGKGRGGKK